MKATEYVLLLGAVVLTMSGSATTWHVNQTDGNDEVATGTPARKPLLKTPSGVKLLIGLDALPRGGFARKKTSGSLRIFGEIWYNAHVFVLRCHALEVRKKTT